MNWNEYQLVNSQLQDDVALSVYPSMLIRDMEDYWVMAERLFPLANRDELAVALDAFRKTTQ